ncbi:MAG: multicopper oxidase domain-containing protein, partial [Rhodospirillales bacterium]|nr:multicopper oxidase domain-containing protein [Rhodospirillales bacterium]
MGFRAAALAAEGMPQPHPWSGFPRVDAAARRQLLASAAATITLAALPGGSARATGNASTLPLAACRRTIEVNGRAATVLGLLQPDGRSGVVLEPGQRFRVGLENRLDEPTLVHWHGQTPPMDQDGVPGAVQPPLLPGTGAAYDFTPRPGTHWMHSHIGLQEQMLLAAPLIVREGSDEDAQEVVLMLHDFTFRPPAEVLADLQAGPAHGVHDQAAVTGTPVPRLIAVQQAMVMSQRRLVMGGYDAMTEHPHDIEYDAYLANDRTLADPEVVRVSPGGRVRLRVINGASATSFHLDLGALPGSVVAVDGNPVAPFSSSRFLPLAMGQRLDVLLTLPPRQQGAW